jgi:hypothetical protein
MLQMISKPAAPRLEIDPRHGLLPARHPKI